MKRYLLLFSVFILFSCSKNNLKKEFYEDGTIKLELEVNKEGLQNGFYREYYKSGELKTKTNFLAGVNNDTLYSYYKNGKIKEKGILKNNKKDGWWKYYDSDGNLGKKIEYIILNGGVYNNQTIFYKKNGSINNELSSYFQIHLPDTFKLGKNIGSIDYNSNFKPEERLLYILIENEYSKTEKKVDTFIEKPNHSRFGVFTYKKGVKKVKGKIIEQLIYHKKINKDSAELKIEEHKKYFNFDVFVQ